MHKTINGWTKQEMLDRIESDFKGKATKGTVQCAYLTLDGRRCGIGLFIPKDHDSESFNGGVVSLLDAYPDLFTELPLDIDGSQELQMIHDNLSGYSTLIDQKNVLKQWINNRVTD